MIVNFIDYVSKKKINLLSAWYDSSDGTERIVNISTAPQYRQAKAKIQAEKDRQASNRNVLNHYGIFK